MSAETRTDFMNRPSFQRGFDGPLQDRRAFLGGSAKAFAAGLGGLSLLKSPLMGDVLERKQKRVLVIFLNGGASQFETWDPKPGRPTGGPFISIPTSVPGYRISELMPRMAMRLHKHTAVIRSLDTKNGDHISTLEGGKPTTGVLRYPGLGAMIAHELAAPESQLPHSVVFSNYIGQSYYESAGFLGSRWDPIDIKPGTLEAVPPFTIPQSVLRLAPEGLTLPGGLTDSNHLERGELRALLNREFVAGRGRDSALASLNSSYSRVRGLMSNAKLFDLEREPQRIRDLYGPTPFGKQALVARRLIEAGVPYVRVNRGWWDTHGQNFEAHNEMVPELDHVMSVLLDDLQERGLLEQTLVVTFSEMGRTPHININQGRDHFPRTSATLSGCGIKPGTIYGKTDEDGNDIVEGRVSLQQFFATIFKAVGIDHTKENVNPSDGRPVPLTDYGTDPVKEVLV